MAKNLSREFATMSEDERRRYTMEAEDGTDSAPAELDFENPREEQTPAGPGRDGASAELDEQVRRRAQAEPSEEDTGPEAA